jgi:uncharacterized membrane protein
LTAGILLGVGMGGFVDGIVFHQLLQVHSMLSARLPRTSLTNLEVNMFWDGVFHAFTWATTALGIVLLWRATGRPEVPRSAGALVGSLALGWGMFNLIEGVINHHLLHLHHVTEGENHLVWDLAFLASGVALIAIGIVTIRWSLRRPARGNGTGFANSER